MCKTSLPILRSQRHFLMSPRRCAVLTLFWVHNPIQINFLEWKEYKGSISLQNNCILIVHFPLAWEAVVSQYIQTPSLHVSCRHPHYADFIFYCVQYSNRSSYPKKYYKDRSFKLHILEQVETLSYINISL